MADTVLSAISVSAGVGWLDLGWAAGLEAALGVRARTACFIEWESYAATVLLARMEEQALEPAPVFCGDIGAFPFRQFRGSVDTFLAGFPCQPHSIAGKRKNKEDERWIWPEIAQGIEACQPSVVLLENVPGLLRNDGLAHCLRDLHGLGFDAEWDRYAAADVGASHLRQRVFILAYTPSFRAWAVEQRRQWAGSLGSSPDMADAQYSTRSAERQPGARRRQGGRAVDQSVPGGSGVELVNAQHSKAGDGATGPAPATPGRKRRRAQHRSDGTIPIAGVSRGLAGSRLQHGQLQQRGDGPEHPGECHQLGDSGLGLHGEATEPGRGDAVDPELRCGELARAAGAGLAGGERPGASAQRDGTPAHGPTPELCGALPVADAGRKRGGQDAPPAAGGGPHLDDRRLPAFPPGPGLGGHGVVDGLLKLLAKHPDRAWRSYQAELGNTVRWIDILRHWPHLAPAVEPDVCVLADGQPLLVDASRADQLRCGGNGVVWQQAAYAAADLLIRITQE